MFFPTKPNRRETLLGGIYLILYMAVLPWLVPLVVRSLVPSLNVAQVNFIFFVVNFAATTVIFHRFLTQSLKDAAHVPGPTLRYAIWGYLGSMMLGSLVASLILRIDPEFANVNDRNIDAMVSQNFTLMAIGAVILAPVTEELLFRGLIFRNLYDRSPLAAHLISMIIFSVIHISGYVGHYDTKTLMLCFLQYLPAAYCLNFAYKEGKTIASPILMHMLTNLISLLAMR